MGKFGFGKFLKFGLGDLFVWRFYIEKKVFLCFGSLRFMVFW